jgi:hypothetical protein
MALPPDWVCEIVSPGHEKKDTVQIPLLLRRHQLPCYWLIWPEDRTLVAHTLDGNGWRVITTLKERQRGRVPPFETVEVDLGVVLGDGRNHIWKGEKTSDPVLKIQPHPSLIRRLLCGRFLRPAPGAVPHAYVQSLLDLFAKAVVSQRRPGL